MTVRDQIYNVVANTSGAIRADDIAKKVKAHPAHIRQLLTALYHTGKVKRAEAKMPSSYRGKKPYYYYVDHEKNDVAPAPQGVKVLVGKTEMTVTEARNIYNQLKMLFS